MKLILLTRRSLVTLGLSVICGVTAAGVMISSAAKAVQTAAEPRKIPIYRVESDKKQVAISFDAAWGNEQTEELLQILDDHKVKATFFLVGKWVDDFPDDVKSIAAHGNDIGNHSDTHPHMPQIGKSECSQELEACNQKIEKLTGKSPTLFRPPYGDYDNTVVDCVNSHGMYCVQWDVDSLDWKGPTPEQMTKTVLDKVRDGSIVLMHNGAKNTPAALPGIIKGIKDKGFEIVLIKDLLPEGDYYTDVQGELHLMEN
ncbi:MAG: polysaccharide deacetylase family protein [Ruminococcus sp.]|nr:polysaccharide deacetylase family protein [Ruminococcus sp.]